MSQMMNEKHDINSLNQLYLDANSCDQELFAEQRSNLLLVAGEHYTRKQSSFFRRIRDAKDLTAEQKLRLTKNHIQNICKQYSNNIISSAPGIGFEPKDEQSIQNQKSAELHHAVWNDACEKYGIKEGLIDEWCDDFIQVGEVAVKIFFDPYAGPIKAYQQKVDESGQPIYHDAQGMETPEPTDEMGQPHAMAPDEELPVHAGAFVFEEVYGFNLLRAPQAKRMSESPYLIVRKMVEVKDMQERYAAQPDKAKVFTDSPDETFMVFDGTRKGYNKNIKGQCMILEYYFRPCQLYPQGYFFFTTKQGVFEEGELPGGIFPIVMAGYERVQTSPRWRSPIKHMRPYQVEINRAASKMAEHQVTLGDDKLLVQNGTKVSAGVGLPGVRSVNFTGGEPKILPGRSGEQYLSYMQSQITELYQVMNADEGAPNPDAGQLDPYALLFRSASQKRKFQRYIRRFEFFLMEVCKTYLKLAKVHLPDDQLIYAVGKNEQVNIPEFKRTDDMCYQIKVEAQADDIESKMGKQLVLNHVLQYVGPQMKPEDIGKVMRQMPYANFDKTFEDFTINFDSLENDILALDRGQQVPADPSDDHVYFAKKLRLRTRKPDFQFMAPAIKQNYEMRIKQHEQFEAMRQLQLQRAEQGYIPTGGALLGCDFFVADPADPTKTRRARLPSESIQWLVKQLEAQGQGLMPIMGADPATQGDIAGMVAARAAPAQMPGVQRSSVMPPKGATLSF